MEQQSRTREELESAIRGLPDDVVDVGGIKVVWPIATSTVFDGKVTMRDVFGGATCSERSILDVAARGVTQSDGTVLIHLNDFHCEDVEPVAGSGGIAYESPITVLATPRDNTPVHIAVEAHVGPDRAGNKDDVLITVRSWDANGAPVAASFNWRCTVPYGSALG
jgi:hypothetical protein